MRSKVLFYRVMLIFCLAIFSSSGYSFSGEATSWLSAGWAVPSKSASAGGMDEDLKKAQSNYGLYCASCHGQNGNGQGDLAAALSTPPRNHTDASIMSTRTDQQIFTAISEGGEAIGLDSTMPPHNTIISKEEIQQLVKYIRYLCKCDHK